MIEAGEVFELGMDGEKVGEFRVVACDKEQNLYTGYKFFHGSDSKQGELAIFYITPDFSQFREASFMYFTAEEGGYGFGQPGNS